MQHDVNCTQYDINKNKMIQDKMMKKEILGMILLAAVLFISATVAAQPDFAVLNKTEYWTNQSEGQYKINFTVENLGSPISDTSGTVGIFIDGVNVATPPLSALKANSVVYYNMGPYILSGASDTILVSADYTNMFAENNEANNNVTNVLETPGRYCCNVTKYVCIDTDCTIIGYANGWYNVPCGSSSLKGNWMPRVKMHLIETSPYASCTNETYCCNVTLRDDSGAIVKYINGLYDLDCSSLSKFPFEVNETLIRSHLIGVENPNPDCTSCCNITYKPTCPPGVACPPPQYFNGWFNKPCSDLAGQSIPVITNSLIKSSPYANCTNETYCCNISYLVIHNAYSGHAPSSEIRYINGWFNKPCNNLTNQSYGFINDSLIETSPYPNCINATYCCNVTLYDAYTSQPLRYINGWYDINCTALNQYPIRVNETLIKSHLLEESSGPNCMKISSCCNISYLFPDGHGIEGYINGWFDVPCNSASLRGPLIVVRKHLIEASPYPNCTTQEACLVTCPVVAKFTQEIKPSYCCDVNASMGRTSKGWYNVSCDIATQSDLVAKDTLRSNCSTAKSPVNWIANYLPKTLSTVISSNDNSNAVFQDDINNSRNLLALAVKPDVIMGSGRVNRYSVLYPEKGIEAYNGSIQVGAEAPNQNGGCTSPECQQANRNDNLIGKVIASITGFITKLSGSNDNRIFNGPYIAVWNAASQSRVYMTAWGMNPNGNITPVGSQPMQPYMPYFISPERAANVTWVGRVPQHAVVELYSGINYITLPLDTEINNVSQLCKSMDITNSNGSVSNWKPLEQKSEEWSCLFAGTIKLNPGVVYSIQFEGDKPEWNET